MSALLFAAGIIFWLAATYVGGVAGGLVGGVLLMAGGLWMGLARWADFSLLAVEAWIVVLMVWLTLRWALRHQGWQKRIAKGRRELEEQRLQLEGVVQHLRNTLAAKGIDIERSLQGHQLIQRLAEADSWEAITPLMSAVLRHLYHAEGWALYLADSHGELREAERRGTAPEQLIADDFCREPTLQIQTGWILRIPLWRLHERIGLLLVSLPEFPPDERQAILSEASDLGTQLIFPMAKAKLYHALAQTSRMDALTGLYSQKAFEERLKEETARVQTFHTTFSVWRVEVDHYQDLVNSAGAPAGQEIVRAVGQCLKESLYDTDVIAHFEGGGFACLLPHADPVGLKSKAEEIRERIKNQAFVIGLEAVRVTLSIEITHFPQAEAAWTETRKAMGDRS